MRYLIMCFCLLFANLKINAQDIKTDKLDTMDIEKIISDITARNRMRLRSSAGIDDHTSKPRCADSTA